MELQEAILTRRSVRRFTDEKVEKEKIQKLLDSAVQSPSAMNSQPWAFVVIQDNNVLKQFNEQSKDLMVSLLDDNPRFEKYRPYLSDPKSDIFYGASTLLVIYAKPEGSAPNEDCSMAAQNVMLSAHEMGLGTCWIGFSRTLLGTAKIKQQLGVPEEYEAVAPLIVGYPALKMPTIKKKTPEILAWLADEA